MRTVGGLRAITDQTWARASIVKDMELVTTTPRTLLPTGDWQLDAGQSRIAFTIAKLGVGSVRGRFLEASASIEEHGDRTVAYGSVGVASLNTGSPDRDEHLRDGLFEAARHPDMTFQAVAIDSLTGSSRITGNLTIRGITSEVELIASPQATVDPARRRLILLGRIDRRAFGLVWGRAIEATGVVATTVELELELEFARRR